MDISKLRELGLSEYEARCYLALVRFGDLSGKEVARHASVPPTSVYRNLDGLVGKGLVVVLNKDPLLYHAPDPSITVEGYADDRRKEIDIATASAVSWLRSLKKGKRASEEEVISTFYGKKQAYASGVQLIKNTKNEYLALGRGEKPVLYDYAHELMKAAKRGVAVKFLTTAYAENKDVYDNLKKHGVLVRSIKVKLTLVVSDSSVKDRDFAKANREYFLNLWKKGSIIS
jgi:HTH-type transcriptional regulator, sugar sensing transcriptional regulator